MLSVIFHIFVALGFRFKNIMKYAKKRNPRTQIENLLNFDEYSKFTRIVFLRRNVFKM